MLGGGAGPRQAFTVTVGDRAENEIGMEIIGSPAARGLSEQQLGAIQRALEAKGVTCELVPLAPLAGTTVPGAWVLVVPGGVTALLQPEYGPDSVLAELVAMPKDRQGRTKGGKVYEKDARHNNTMADYHQEPDIPNKQGTVVNFKDYPATNALRSAVRSLLRDVGVDHPLVGELNDYHDADRCGIGFHGDKERKLVIGVRLGPGADGLPLKFLWWHKHKPVGSEGCIELGAGVVYIMSETAVGTNSGKSSLHTLRHAAGREGYKYAQMVNHKAVTERGAPVPPVLHWRDGDWRAAGGAVGAPSAAPAPAPPPEAHVPAPQPAAVGDTRPGSPSLAVGPRHPRWAPAAATPAAASAATDAETTFEAGVRALQSELGPERTALRLRELADELEHQLPPPFEQLYWAQADAQGVAAAAVSREFYDECCEMGTVVVLTSTRLEQHQATLQRAAESVPRPDRATDSVDWAASRYNKDALLAQDFVEQRESAIVCRADVVSGRYEVLVVYKPSDFWCPLDDGLCEIEVLCYPQMALDELTTNAFGSARKGERCGEYRVKARGSHLFDGRCNKPASGEMLMYGYHATIPTTKGGPVLPGRYAPKGKVDTGLDALVETHAEKLAALERHLMPAAAGLRDHLAATHDPDARFRLSGNVLALSLARGYAVVPHDDSGAAAETILFRREGDDDDAELPPGHEWWFAAAGLLFRLPSGPAWALLSVKGQGLWHGTLPTSATEPSLSYGLIGSALVTKEPMLRALDAQRVWDAGAEERAEAAAEAAATEAAKAAQAQKRKEEEAWPVLLHAGLPLLARRQPQTILGLAVDLLRNGELKGRLALVRESAKVALRREAMEQAREAMAQERIDGLFGGAEDSGGEEGASEEGSGDEGGGEEGDAPYSATAAKRAAERTLAAECEAREGVEHRSKRQKSAVTHELLDAKLLPALCAAGPPPDAMRAGPLHTQAEAKVLRQLKLDQLPAGSVMTCCTADLVNGLGCEEAGKPNVGRVLNGAALWAQQATSESDVIVGGRARAGGAEASVTYFSPAGLAERRKVCGEKTAAELIKTKRCTGCGGLADERCHACE